MSLQSRLADFITAVGTDVKTLRTYITGSASGTLSGLNTTDKSSIVAALNEVKVGTTGPSGAINLLVGAEIPAGTGANILIVRTST